MGCCETVELPDGTRAIVCTRGRVSKKKKPSKCVVCRIRPGVRECDWKVGKKNGAGPGGSVVQVDATCDMPLCESCTYSPAPEKDLCPHHKVKYEKWVLERAKNPATQNHGDKS